MSGIELEQSRDRVEQHLKYIQEYTEYINEDLSDIYYESPNDSQIADRISRIFRSSFPVSNGSPLVQFLLQASAINILDYSIGHNKMCDTFNDFTVTPSEYYPPKRHAKIGKAGKILDSDRLDQRITEIWNIYQDIAVNVQTPSNIQETEEMLPSDWIYLKTGSGVYLNDMYVWSRLAGRDLFYLENGRPKAGSLKAKYRSNAKTYILDGQTTGSPELDIACRIVRSSLKYALDTRKIQPQFNVISDVRASFKSLAHVWEEKHSALGQFTPVDIAPLVGHPQIQPYEVGDGWEIISSYKPSKARD